MRPPIVAALALILAVPAVAEDWPQFRGLARDGHSPEQGLLKKWPDKGPELLWTAKDLGVGWTSAAIAKGSIYTTGMVGSDIVLFALGLDGKQKFKATLGPAWTAMKVYRGSRGTPTVHGGLVYVITGQGLVCCYRATDGTKVWSVDMLARFEAKNLKFGMSESPLIDGDRLS